VFKECTGCGINKSFDEYGKDKKAEFGLNQKCKLCCRARDKKKKRSKESLEKHKKYKSEWQKKKRVVLNERLRKRYHEDIEKSRDQARKRAVKYRATQEYKEKKNEYDRSYRKTQSEKARARGKVKYAISMGYLRRPNICEWCSNEGKIHAHHEDYSKSLCVIWVCDTCHLSYHKSQKFHAERLSEKTPKGDAKVWTSEETTRGESEEFLPP